MDIFSYLHCVFLPALRMLRNFKKWAGARNEITFGKGRTNRPLVSICPSRGLYTSQATYMITLAESGRRTCYRAYEDIPLTLVTFLPLLPFRLSPRVHRLYRERWNMPEPSGDSYVKLDRENPSPYIIESCLNRQILNHENSKLDSLNYSSCELLLCNFDCLSIFMGNIASGARYCYFFDKIFYWKAETTRFENKDEGQPVLFFFLFPIICNFYAIDTAWNADTNWQNRTSEIRVNKI